jgi:hypothetical protein
MRVRQPTGHPASRMRYSIRAPLRISIGSEVTKRKPTQGGVSASRFAASEKNAKTSSSEAGMRCSRSRRCVRAIGTGYPPPCARS